MKKTYLFIILTFLACSMKKESQDIVIGELPKGEVEFQKMIIAQLTGAKAMKSVKGEEILLHDRWDIQDRQLTVDYLSSLIRELSLTPIEQDYRMPNLNFGIDLLLEPFRGTNLYTILPATTNSVEYIILGAHYDTGAKNVPGAIDNGSGMALIASVLRQMSALESRNKNLIVVFFDQEEEELIGSKAFTRLIKKLNFDIHSVHTFDMVGWDGDHNREVELELPTTEIENLYNKHANRLGIPTYTTSVNSSDHYSFIQEGFTAVGVSQAYAKRDNSGKKDTPEDKYDLVNFEFLNSTSNLVYEVVKDLMDD